MDIHTAENVMTTSQRFPLSDSSDDIHDLLKIMQVLRDPQNGCPWDQKQNFASIAPYTIEEAYEVADAIARQDFDELRDELGDLLLQVVYHAQMAEEQSHFKFSDVVQSICSKMIRRHPHVFGDDQQCQQGKPDWESFKQQEREQRGDKDDPSALAGVPVGLQSMLRAKKLQKKAARVNFDWSNIEAVLEKLEEEVAELKQAVASGQQAAIEDELGDVLFCAINVSRHSQHDADIALQKASNKFEQRFRVVEKIAKQKRQDIKKLSEQQLEDLWQQAKKLIIEAH